MGLAVLSACNWTAGAASGVKNSPAVPVTGSGGPSIACVSTGSGRAVGSLDSGTGDDPASAVPGGGTGWPDGATGDDPVNAVSETGDSAEIAGVADGGTVGCSAMGAGPAVDPAESVTAAGGGIAAATDGPAPGSGVAEPGTGTGGATETGASATTGEPEIAAGGGP